MAWRVMACLRLTLVFGLPVPNRLAAGQAGDAAELPATERPIHRRLTAPGTTLRLGPGDRLTATVAANRAARSPAEHRAPFDLRARRSTRAIRGRPATTLAIRV